MNRQIARETKLLWPNMAQVTAVRLPSGLNVNSAVLVPAIGCTKSRLILMSSAERHAHLSAVGERREHAVGLGFVLGVDREREALEFRLALRAAVGRHHRLAVDAKA